MIHISYILILGKKIPNLITDSIKKCIIFLTLPSVKVHFLASVSTLIVLFHTLPITLG